MKRRLNTFELWLFVSEVIILHQNTCDGLCNLWLERSFPLEDFFPKVQKTNNFSKSISILFSKVPVKKFNIDNFKKTKAAKEFINIILKVVIKNQIISIKLNVFF